MCQGVTRFVVCQLLRSSSRHMPGRQSCKQPWLQAAAQKNTHLRPLPHAAAAAVGAHKQPGLQAAAALQIQLHKRAAV